MQTLKRDLNCPHCLGVGSFGGVLFGGPQDCYCVRPVPCSRCEGNGKDPEKPSGKFYCRHCKGTGEEPRPPQNEPVEAIEPPKGELDYDCVPELK